MSYTLEEFCGNTTQTLAGTPGAAGREAVRNDLERLLKDQAFLAKYCGPDAEPGIRTVYRCPQTGYNVLVHVYEKGKKGPPHDHGDSWAIYGQAVGHTVMSIWKRLDAGGADGKANLEQDRVFRLDPGMAGTFEPRDIHGIEISDGAKFVRVTGTDLNTIETLVFNASEGTVQPGNRL